jgi:hypothetical protein
MPRKKLDKVQSHWRVKKDSVEVLSQIAKALGYEYDDRGAVGEMLDAIADGEILLVNKRK